MWIVADHLAEVFNEASEELCGAGPSNSTENRQTEKRSLCGLQARARKKLIRRVTLQRDSG